MRVEIGEKKFVVVARNKEKEQKQRQKTYADKHRRAKERKVEVGDQLLIRQKKTTTSPPFDPAPYSVEEVKGTKITARRGREIKTRNIEKWKVLKTRPAYLQKPQKGDLGVVDEDDWFCYPTATSDNAQQARQAQESQREQEEVEQLSSEEENVE